jgi:hypothetical protein
MNKSLILKLKSTIKYILIFFFSILAAALLFYAFQDFIFPASKWRKELRPYADNFLELLKNNNYDELYSKYAFDSDMNRDIFEKEFEKLHNVFGRIKSYSYKGASTSHGGKNRVLTSFYIYYWIEFDSGKSYHGSFGFDIDRKTNRPKAGRIKTFRVIGNLEEKEIFYIRLIEEQREGVANTRGQTSTIDQERGTELSNSITFL